MYLKKKIPKILIVLNENANKLCQNIIVESYTKTNYERKKKIYN